MQRALSSISLWVARWSPLPVSESGGAPGRSSRQVRKVGMTKKAKEAKVLVVEDHPIVRHGLMHLIEGQEDLTVCGEAESAPDALKAIGKSKPDVVIVDISLKGANGVKLIKDIKAQSPNLPVLVLSMYEESLYAERTLRAGAKGYVMKQEATETLLTAIRRVLGGDIWVSEDIASRMLRKFVDRGNPGLVGPVDSLSDRELEVFEFVGRGLGTRQIAAKLDLSVRTVESYRAHIKQKLSLKNAAELVQHAVHWVQSEGAG